MFSHALVTAFPQAFAPSVSPLPPPPPPRLAAEGASSKALYHRRLQQALDQRRAPVTGRFIGGALIEGTIYYDGRFMEGASQALPRRCLLTGASTKALHERRFMKGASTKALQQRRLSRGAFTKGASIKGASTKSAFTKALTFYMMLVARVPNARA